MRHETIATRAGHRLVLMDSISLIGPQDADAVIVSGSHGGPISGAFARRHPPALVFFNDAGFGKRRAGVAALAMLDEAGIPAAAVAHDSARIGDAQDAWESGRVSARNGLAARAGLALGQAVQEAVERFCTVTFVEEPDRAATRIGTGRAAPGRRFQGPTIRDNGRNHT